jgi:hypothetical protein
VPVFRVKLIGFHLISQLLERFRPWEIRAHKHPASKTATLANCPGLLAADPAEAAAPLPRQWTFRHEQKLVVEHNSGSANCPARRCGVNSDAAPNIDRKLLASEELLQENERRILANPAAGFVTARNQARNRHASKRSRLRGVGDLREQYSRCRLRQHAAQFGEQVARLRRQDEPVRPLGDFFQEA